MLKVLALPAACLILCGTAIAQDRPGLAPLNPPDRAQPVPVNEPEQTSSTVPSGAVGVRGPDGERAEVARPALRGSDPAAARTVAALKGPSGGPRPWCAQERRVGTGAGFCLIN
jgi:hypothetical protein